MAIFQSAAYMGGAIFRTLGDQPAEITTTIEVPANYRLLTTDKLLAFRVGEGHSIDEVIVRSEALDNAQTPTLTLNVGYEAAVAADDPDAFAAAATFPRAGGQSQVENGGTPAFAVGALAPINEVLDIVAIPAANAAAAAGTGTLGTGVTAKTLTVTAKISRKVNAPSGTPYTYGS
jgi:hypothetical protein